MPQHHSSNYIKNRKSNDQILSIWNLLAVYWNNSSFEPITEVIPDLHSEFLTPKGLSYNKVTKLPLATPEKCKEKLNSMILQLNFIIVSWRRHLQGDEGVGADVYKSNDELHNATT